MIRHFFSRQFLGFVLVGGGAAFVNWLSRLALGFWVPFPLAVSVAYLIGMVTAFVLNRQFVFPQSTRPITKQARDFFMVNLFFFPVVWLASVMINEQLASIGVEKYSEGIAHALALALPMVITFLFYKFVAFKEVDRGWS